MEMDKIIDSALEVAIQPLIDLVLLQISEDIIERKSKGDPFHKTQLKAEEVQQIRSFLTSYLSLEKERQLIKQAFRVLINELPRLPNYKLIEEDLRKAGRLLLESGDTEEFPYIFDTMQEMIGLNDETLMGIYTLGVQFYEEKREDDALALFCLLTRLNNRCPDPWLMLGICYSDKHNWLEALFAYSMASLMKFENPGPHIYSSECYAELGQIELALESLNLGISQIPKDETKYEPIIKVLKKRLNLW